MRVGCGAACSGALAQRVSASCTHVNAVREADCGGSEQGWGSRPQRVGSTAAGGSGSCFPSRTMNASLFACGLCRSSVSHFYLPTHTAYAR